jgi:hypothetical protein
MMLCGDQRVVVVYERRCVCVCVCVVCVCVRARVRVCARMCVHATLTVSVVNKGAAADAFI